ncbi:MAG: DMT family transporter [Pseudomonadota bacterium]
MSSNLKGILWALLAACLFSIGVAMAKHAAFEFHVLQILFFRQLVVFLSVVPELARDLPNQLKTAHPGLHLIRLTGAFTALAGGIWAVTVLPFSTAVTLGFAQVFFVTLLAALFLGERVGPYRVGAVVVGFLGVVVAMRPGAEGVLDLNALIPIAGAFGAGVAIVSVRRLSQTESTATLLAWQALFVGALSGVPMLWFWVTPGLGDLAFLLAMGIVAATGQWIGVRAIRLGEAVVIGPIEYTKLIYATVIGYFAFAELPDVWTVTGAAIIVGSALFILYRERRVSSR